MRFLIVIALVISTATAADFTTYIGDANPYQVVALTTDSAGNTYVTGGRAIPGPGVSPLNDVFVTKLDSAGNIVFTTTFGGKGSDQGAAIALDPAGNIWVGGSTSSTNFPLYDPLQANPGPGTTGFLAKLAPDGTLIYASYLGGTMGTSSVNGIAIDPNGNLYLTGTTNSSDFTTTPGLPTASVHPGLTAISGAFITKLDPTASHITYSALLVGTAVECLDGSTCFLSDRNTTGVGIGIDQAGEALVAGYSNTTDLPVTPGALPGYGAFAAKINAAGDQLSYLTYLSPAAGSLTSYGPEQYNTATAIAVDATGNAYIAGSTNDPLLPTTTGAFQINLNAGTTQSIVPSDAFAVKLSPSGKVTWATYLGGPGNDAANSISLDTSGNVWLVGNNAAGFPTPSPGILAAPGDFLAELSADGSQLLYTQEFATGTAGQSLHVNSGGVAYVAGITGLISTITPKEPAAPRVFGIANAAAGEVSGRIAPGEIVSIYGFSIGPSPPVTAIPANGSFPTSLGGLQVLLNGAAIPLLYVSASQINAEIPAPLYDTEAILRVVGAPATLPDFRVSFDAAIPGIFQNPDRTARAINQDGSINSASNPAKVGAIVSIWLTGVGGNQGPPVDGQISTAANNWCPYCSIVFDGSNVTVQYGGSAPGLIDGAMQINFTIPPQFNIDNPIPIGLDGAFAFLYIAQ